MILHYVQKKLLTKFDAPKNQPAHENRYIKKRPSHIPTVLLYQLDFFPLVNALVYVNNIDQDIHQGKKGLTDRVKPSEVTGSFYAMVFMALYVCSSIDFC